MKIEVKRMTFSAMIAAVYFVCCFFEQNFASGAIQCRLSEGFCLLPLFFFEAVPGVTIGCLLYNIFFGVGVYDMIFGTFATLISGVITYFIGRVIKKDWLRIIIGGIPPIIINALVIPGVLILSSVNDGLTYGYLFLTVGLGELIAVYAVGFIIYFPLKAMFEKYHMINN